MCNICIFNSCANLWVLRKVSYRDFERFQHSHGSGRRLVQHVPHAWLQQMGLRRRLRNCDSDLPTNETLHNKTPHTLNYFVPSSNSSILHTRAQKLLMASGGKPLLRSAVKVKSLGSSQSLHSEKSRNIKRCVNFDRSDLVRGSFDSDLKKRKEYKNRLKGRYVGTQLFLCRHRSAEYQLKSICNPLVSSLFSNLKTGYYTLWNLVGLFFYKRYHDTKNFKHQKRRRQPFTNVN